jgi:hypothetical protein
LKGGECVQFNEFKNNLKLKLEKMENNIENQKFKIANVLRLPKFFK